MIPTTFAGWALAAVFFAFAGFFFALGLFVFTRLFGGPVAVNP